jgi:hypothetical protein
MQDEPFGQSAVVAQARASLHEKSPKHWLCPGVSASSKQKQLVPAQGGAPHRNGLQAQTPLEQLPEQQASGCVHGLPTAVQATQVCWRQTKPGAQAAVHVPPQPSLAPPHLPVQLGVQHAPLWQVCPLAHVVPHVPQFCVSECVSTQAPALDGPASAGQHVWGAEHRLPVPQMQLAGPPPAETQLLPLGPQSVPVQQTPLTQVWLQQRWSAPQSVSVAHPLH